MRLPEHERDAHRAAFRAMTPLQKAEYVLAYYKLPLVLALIAAVTLGSVVRYRLTHKEPLLYVAYANVQLPEEQEAQLADGFLACLGADPSKSEITRYHDLYLAEAKESVDHQYSYASRLKTLAAVDAEELDVVLMNREAYDLLSASGYLMDLREALARDDALLAEAQGLLTTNTVVLEDNRVEVDLGEADEYVAQTEEVANALDVTDALGGASTLTGTVYLGVIGNTPRLDTALELLRYLLA